MPTKKIPPLTCIWGDCSVVCCTYEEFRDHNARHLQKSCDSMGIDCGICGAPLSQNDQAQRHVNFHSWVTLLCTLGALQQEKNGWPTCDLDEYTNVVPDFPTPFSCGWKNCSFQTNDEYEGEEVTKCQWENCDHVCGRKNNLRAHLRCHTQEKLTACPQCGFMFTSISNLRDHLMRQISSDRLEVGASSEELRCPYCSQMFATKSLINAHVSRHINTHKCPLCNLTLRTKSAVKRHILFRHIEKPNVQCPHCPSMFKDIHCLRSHISRRHPFYNKSSEVSAEPDRPIGPLGASGSAPFSSAGSATTLPCSIIPQSNRSAVPRRAIFHCPEPGCVTTTKTKAGLSAHMTVKHPPNEPEGCYACHLCPLRTNKGFILSRHLIRKHSHQRPAGHSRFSYVLCPEDGLYRLETTRLESVEIASELLGEQTVNKLLDDVSLVQQQGLVEQDPF